MRERPNPNRLRRGDDYRSTGMVHGGQSCDLVTAWHQRPGGSYIDSHAWFLRSTRRGDGISKAVDVDAQREGFRHDGDDGHVRGFGNDLCSSEHACRCQHQRQYQFSHQFESIFHIGSSRRAFCKSSPIRYRCTTELTSVLEVALGLSKTAYVLPVFGKPRWLEKLSVWAGRTIGDEL